MVLVSVVVLVGCLLFCMEGDSGDVGWLVGCDFPWKVMVVR